MSQASIARVLIDSPLPQLDQLYDYRVPDALAETVRPGVRVKVPFRNRIASGYLVELATDADFTGKLSDLDSVVSAAPVLAPEVWALARRVADRAGGSASDVLRLAIPKRQARVETAWLGRQPTDPPAPIAPADIPAFDDAMFDAILERGGRAAVDAVPLTAPLPDGRWVGEWAIAMAALASRALPRGHVILGVPDYRDQEQLVAALEAVLPAERIVTLDARQADRDRYAGFLRCLEEEPVVIVGNRSAIYAPAARLALIALWDDGDPLHAEPLAPYVHSRDVALVRQEQQGCALAFFGHTRSTEVERLVEVGWVQAIAPRRAYLPRVIPTAYQRGEDPLAQRARIPSGAWSAARDALADGPVLVQVARPGYSPQLVCASCRVAARCRHCGGPLGLASRGAAPSCGWCGAIASDWACDRCAGTELRQGTGGSTRTAEDLGRAFPGVAVIVADGERNVLGVSGTPALVIATRGAEPIASGGYRAVLLLDGERMLARESLRIAEDCLRWWSNATALAAPGAPVMLVGVSGSIATALATWRLADYARAELSDRKRLRFPPAVRAATVTGTAEEVAAALAVVPDGPGVDVLGPVATERGSVRAIVRFDYSAGGAVASSLRAELIRNATIRRSAVPPNRRPAPPTLRVRFDDLEPFTDES
ncbi:primosomal protein N' [Cryobacterium sp. BB736]|uniref:primosomal protein N' family DNA-binding protein n=1 Tax=Cryobacterium sp. BB736 TaxID=2746963 RepID=UPI0018764A24|nr:primosomal protein N' [Cryobacterium sp. BB736]